ncbi:aminotransferase class I/II-fold pyridoxal phosphate-dependent enzyme [Humibacter ginsenosidimutans]|uniref:Aromatic amino acid aminotransferase n=1 Tax=Humibacter ginsenosidimutans TaxID=2599293 RepID=A0A5B8MAQ1_9MICO|nr:aminotransferase class I/II-fold pyridoxal phosphate-dependent enzyme [Humibacter ginsenosidimutans]
MLLRPEIASLAAYAQGRVPPSDGFKLSSNENPFDPLPGVLDAVASSTALNRYPDGAALALRDRLAERFGVGTAQVHLGAGSVALLSQFINAAAGPGDEVLYAWRSFEAYPGLVTVSGASSVTVPLLPDARHDLDGMVAAITDRTRVIIVCTPNNPTGPVVTADEFERFMAAVPSDRLVLLDEAYVEFVTDPSHVDGRALIGHYPNLVVLRTFSKAYGLAGLRIGYAIGPERLLNAARSTAIPMSVTDLAQSAALASLDREDELLARVATIAERRAQLRDGLLEQGWQVPQAQGNFVWLPTGIHTPFAIDAFFDAGLAVRGFVPDGIRVGVGEEDSVGRVLKIAQQVVDHLRKASTAEQLG